MLPRASIAQTIPKILGILLCIPAAHADVTIGERAANLVGHTHVHLWVGCRGLDRPRERPNSPSVAEPERFAPARSQGLTLSPSVRTGRAGPALQRCLARRFGCLRVSGEAVAPSAPGSDPGLAAGARPGLSRQRSTAMWWRR